jgi:hypothetical protein
MHDEEQECKSTFAIFANVYAGLYLRFPSFHCVFSCASAGSWNLLLS